MTDLKDIQGAFQAAVTTGEGDFIGEIAEGGKISPQKRLAIYAHAYGARLRDVLRADFPALCRLMGEEDFTVMCDAYIKAHPSVHPSLRFFGQHMEVFLKNTQPYKDTGILAEMAGFEWCFINVFDAPDDEIATFDDVARIPPAAWTTLRLTLHASVHLMPLHWNVAAVWEGGEEVEALPEMRLCLHWRQDLKSYFRTLDRDEASVLTLAMAQKSFPVLCETLAEDQGDNAPMKAAEFLKKWISDGLICGLDYADLT